MSWTKRQFVEEAFEELGFASYIYDLAPEQLQAALRRLDAMMASWNANGIRLGYPLSSSPEDSELDTETNVPDSANEAIYLALAVRLAPTVGKQVSPETKQSAKAAYNNMLTQLIELPEMQFQRLPSGAGNKSWRFNNDPFLEPPTSSIETGNDGDLEFD